MQTDEADPPAAVASLLDLLLAQALELARRTRDHLLHSSAPAPESAADLVSALTRAAEFGRITSRLTASVAWLLARRAVLAGELEAQTATDPDWRLLALDEAWSSPLAVTDPVLAALDRESAILYARLRRLDAALDSKRSRGH